MNSFRETQYYSDQPEGELSVHINPFTIIGTRGSVLTVKARIRPNYVRFHAVTSKQVEIGKHFVIKSYKHRKMLKKSGRKGVGTNQNDNRIPPRIKKESMPDLRQTGLVQHYERSEHFLLRSVYGKCRQN